MDESLLWAICLLVKERLFPKAQGNLLGIDCKCTFLKSGVETRTQLRNLLELAKDRADIKSRDFLGEIELLL